MKDACSEPGIRTVDQALADVMALIQPIQETESIALKDALGRVLAEDVQSELDVPGFRNSYMDGYALRHADHLKQATLTVVGTSWAGRPFVGAIKENECVRIFTGARVPDSADCVVMQEHVTREDDRITIHRALQPEDNLRYPGDDIQCGQTILHSGHRLQAADLGLLASVGHAQVTAYRQPRIAFLSTGDELVPVEQSLGEGQIHDSNRYLLFGLLRDLGVEATDLGIIPDQSEVLERTLQQAARDHDIIITSGGASVGDADYIARLIRKLGHMDFWKIAMRPGKPQVVGQIGNARLFGLPGNPVSVMVNFCQIVRPAILHMMGCRERFPYRIRAQAACHIAKVPGRMEFQRGTLSLEDGALRVRPTGHQGSHVLSSVSRANCFIVLELDSAGVEAGETVQIELFKGPLKQDYG